MRKILITASTFPRWEGDTEPRFILDYAKAMTKYYEVHVLVPMAPGAREEEVMDGVFVHRFHYFPIRKWETLCYPGAIVPRIREKKIRIVLVPFLLIGLRSAAKKYSKMVDLVHAHWLIPQGIVQAGIKGTPYIVTGHGGDVTGLNMWPMKWIKRKVLEGARHIITVSNALDGYIQKIFPNEKTSIIPMGCDTDIFSNKNRVENFYKQNNRKVILYVGRLAEVKGVTYLISAMKNVDEAILYIVGGGDREEELRMQAQEISDRVVFVGAKCHAELPVIYASADVFVAPSITTLSGEREGFGLVILEAMASGVPVVASESGGIVDIIVDGYNGLLCEEKNPEAIATNICKIISEDELRQRLIDNGKKTAEDYSYYNVARRNREIIERYLY